MSHIRYALVAALLAASPVAIAGDPEVVQLSPGVYMAVVENHAGVFGSETKTKTKAIAAANKYAEQRGLVAVPVAMEFRRAGGPGQWPAAEYQFRMVPPGQDATVGLKKEADVTVDVQNHTNDNAASKADIYSELLKLDDLKKRGIITEHEFDVLKQKLINR